MGSGAPSDLLPALVPLTTPRTATMFITVLPQLLHVFPPLPLLVRRGDGGSGDGKSTDRIDAGLLMIMVTMVMMMMMMMMMMSRTTICSDMFFFPTKCHRWVRATPFKGIQAWYILPRCALSTRAPCTATTSPPTMSTAD